MRRVTGGCSQVRGSLCAFQRCERAVRRDKEPPSSPLSSWPLAVTPRVDVVGRSTMDASSHPAGRAVLRAHRSGTAAAAAIVLVGTFAAAASAVGAAVSASTPATFDLAAALYRQAGSDLAGAGPPGSRDATSFCRGPVSITATCPCYWKVSAFGDAPGLSLDATLVLAEQQPAGTTDAVLNAAAATLSRASVSRAKIAPAQRGRQKFRFDSRATVIEDAVTVVATAVLRGGTGADNAGRCLTALRMPLRKVEATCPTLDVSYGNSGGRQVRTLSRTAAPVAPPAALDDFLTEEEVLDEREPAAMRDGDAAVAPVSRSFDRVVGGTPLTDPDARRWVVRLYANRDGRFFFACSGSVIGRRYVLTAAHCQMKAGALVRFLPRSELERSPTVDVVAAISHPNYSKGSNENDVAVLRLGSDAPGWPAVSRTQPPPVVINRAPTAPRDGSGVRSSGYGVITEGYCFGSGVARSVDTRVVAPATCEAIFGRIKTSGGRPISDGHSPELMICSGAPKGDCDTCQGDSGGPLYQVGTVNAGGVQTKVSVIVGVTSWGIGCARPGMPGVYARVSAYTEWIDEMVRG